MSALALQGDLFTQRAPRAPRMKGNLQSAAAKHAREMELLKPLVLELARKAGYEGVVVADVRICAVQRGLLSAETKGRELAWMGALMDYCGLEPTDRWRRSHIEKAHGNLQRVWVLPESLG